MPVPAELTGEAYALIQTAPQAITTKHAVGDPRRTVTKQFRCARSTGPTSHSSTSGCRGEPVSTLLFATARQVVADQNLIAPGNRPLRIVNGGKVAKELLI